MKTWLKFLSSAIALTCLNTSSLDAKSLWLTSTTNERGLFADRVAYRIGDIVTIVVNEETTQENTLDTKTNKKATILGAITSFLYPAANTGFGKHNGALPSTNISLSNDDYAGNGAIKNSSKLKISASAVVIDVLPNGNLIIEGKRSIFFSKERQYMVFTGIVRPIDIATDNTIDSKKIADARIEVVNEGELSSAQKKGWLLRFKDAINPF